MTTDSAHHLPVAPDLMQRRFEPPAPNLLWTGDSTYIQTDEGWLYLAAVVDSPQPSVGGLELAAAHADFARKGDDHGSDPGQDRMAKLSRLGCSPGIIMPPPIDREHGNAVMAHFSQQDRRAKRSDLSSSVSMVVLACVEWGLRSFCLNDHRAKRLKSSQADSLILYPAPRIRS